MWQLGNDISADVCGCILPYHRRGCLHEFGRIIELRVMVTGGAGFLGSHVVDELILRRHSVIVVDNLLTGNQDNINAEADFYRADICDTDFDMAFRKFLPLDSVIHLAAQTSVGRSWNEPEEDLRTNIMGTVSLLQCCRRESVHHVVFASSAAVYGDVFYRPITEEDHLCPRSPYGVSKVSAELYLRAYAMESGLRSCIFRFSNIYGPRQQSTGEAGVVAVFVDQLMRDCNPTIYGDGYQTRDFLYVSDAANAIVTAVESSVHGTLNVSTSIGTTVRQLYKIISESLNSSIKPQFKDARQGDVKYSILDNSRARRSMDWEPQIGIREGIRTTTAYAASKCIGIPEGVNR